MMNEKNNRISRFEEFDDFEGVQENFDQQENSYQEYEHDEFNFEGTSDLENEIYKLKKNQPKVKIMLIGGTGVGKSSLVNLVFGKDLAKVGHGLPTTREIKKFEEPGRDVVIFDSEGYEIGEDKLEHFNSKILSTIEDHDIHAVWYCISGPSGRITDEDENIIQEIRSKNVPVYVALTQSETSNPKKIADMKRIIEDIGVKAFAVTTKDLQNINPKTGKKYGHLELIDLMNYTKDNMPSEGLKNAFVKEQNIDLGLKHQQATKIINQHATGNAIVGFTPIPLADAPILLASQMTMIGRLIYLYDLKEQENGIKGIIETIGISGLMQQGGKMASKYALSQALKFIPVIGTYGGGLINGAVAATFTKTLGHTVALVLHKKKEDQLNNTNKMGLLTGESTQMFLTLFKQQSNKFN